MSERLKYIENCVIRFQAAVKPEWGAAPWRELAKCFEVAARDGIEEAYQQLFSLVDAMESRAAIEARAEIRGRAK